MYKTNIAPGLPGAILLSPRGALPAMHSHGFVFCRKREVAVAFKSKDLEAQIPNLRRYALALTRDVSAANDLVQECLTRALSRPHLWQEDTNLRAWLFTILHNEHVNRVRRTVREGLTVLLPEAEPALSTAPDQEKRLEIRDLDRALGKLPLEQRAVVLLVGLEGLRYDKVAEILGVPTGTVRSRLSRGRAALRIAIGDLPAQSCPARSGPRAKPISPLPRRPAWSHE